MTERWRTRHQDGQEYDDQSSGLWTRNGTITRGSYDLTNVSEAEFMQ